MCLDFFCFVWEFLRALLFQSYLIRAKSVKKDREVGILDIISPPTSSSVTCFVFFCLTPLLAHDPQKCIRKKPDEIERTVLVGEGHMYLCSFEHLPHANAALAWYLRDFCPIKN